MVYTAVQGKFSVSPTECKICTVRSQHTPYIVYDSAQRTECVECTVCTRRVYSQSNNVQYQYCSQCEPSSNSTKYCLYVRCIPLSVYQYKVLPVRSVPLSVYQYKSTASTVCTTICIPVQKYCQYDLYHYLYTSAKVLPVRSVPLSVYQYKSTANTICTTICIPVQKYCQYDLYHYQYALYEPAISLIAL